MFNNYIYPYNDSNQTEAAIALLEAGADINSALGETGGSLLIYAAIQRDPSMIRAIATTPDVMLDPQVSGLFEHFDLERL